MTTPKLEPIDSIQPFIDLGYHTVPLNGKQLYRTPEGKKEGAKFTPNWHEQHSTTLNTLATPIGAMLTGKGQLVAIDCDSLVTWELFRKLDPDNTAYFESIGKLDKDGKEIKCGTILYLYSEGLPPSKKVKGDYDIDWFNGTGCVYLPTEPNKTKTTWLESEDGTLYNHNKELIELTYMPSDVKAILELIVVKPVEEKTVADTTHSSRAKGFLGRVLGDYDFRSLITNEQYEPAITRLLTPKEYRSELYHQQGHLHPNDVPARHDYQFQIMCRLAGDNTVDKDLARDVMYYFNSLWDKEKGGKGARSLKQLHAEIIDPIISGRQKNQSGEPYWVYDENWELITSFTVIDKLDNHLLEVFYATNIREYFVYDTSTDSIEAFKTKAQLIEHVVSIASHGINQHESIADMRNVRSVVEPLEDFGFIDNDKKFNLFEPTKALRIIADPSIHAEEYKEPREFIGYMEHFIPNEEQRTYLLALLVTKLKTFKYSPVVPYIIGTQGSGKGLLITILGNIMGDKYISTIQGSEFIKDFNKGWLEDKYFVNLDELNETLENREKENAKGLLKYYTGKDTFLCHGKGKDQYQAPMKAMFIMTANSNPLEIADNDRRIYYIKAPNTFISNPLCKAYDVDTVYKAIITQTEDIAYYLSTEIPVLKGNDYTTAPFNSDKAQMVFDSKKPINKLVDSLDSKEFRMLEDWLLNPIPLYKHHAEGRIYLDDLVEVFEDFYKGEDIDRYIKKAMKAKNLKQKQGYKNKVYWDIDGFSDYESELIAPIDNEAEDIRL